MSIEVQHEAAPPVIDAPLNAGRPATYPFTTMKVGEWFDVPVATPKKGQTLRERIERMRSTAAAARRRHKLPLSFVVREAKNDQGKTVIRVWAIAPLGHGQRLRVDAQPEGDNSAFF